MTRTRWPDALVVSLVSLLLFAHLADEVTQLDWTGWDRYVWLLLSHHEPSASAWFVSLAGAWLGYGLSLAVMIWLSLRGRRTDLWAFCLVVVGAALLSHFMKLAYQIPRPLLDGLPAASGFSFPSGHTLYSACVYGFLGARLWRHQRVGSLLVLTIPFLVAWSRLQLGVHWLSDVLAGLLAGLFWVSFCLHLRARAETYLRGAPQA